MNEDCFLIVPFEEFKLETEKRIAEAGVLYKENPVTAEELEIFKGKVKDWVESSVKIFETMFNIPNQEYADDFKYALAPQYNIPGSIRTLNQLVDQEKKSLQLKQKALWDAIRLIGISDAISKRNQIDVAERQRFSTEQKLELILDKLYDVYDDFYYPIRSILIGNGIILRRYDDDRVLTDMLEGFVETMGTEDGGVAARLTGRGALYVEDARKKFKDTYSHVNESHSQINKYLNSDYVQGKIKIMTSSVITDTDLAIGTAKELLETVCKSILKQKGTDIDSTWSLQRLMKETINVIDFSPKSAENPDDAVKSIKQILGGISGVVQGIAELRNAYGSGHGKDAEFKGLESQYAKLVVGLASEFAIFILVTNGEMAEINE